MLKIEHLTKTYASGNKKAVDDISFEVKDGEIFGFLGPNGAGKTTTIKMVTGILKSDGGTINIKGIDAASNPLEVKKLIAYVPDNPDIQKKLRGIEYINFLADMYDIPSDVRTKECEKYALLFGMKDSLYAPISSYSHGMQQKIVLIGAFVTQPELMILDEPMVGLDPKSAFNLKEAMKAFAKEGKSIFFSTHVLDVAEKFCDRVGIINHGKLIAEGTLEELRNMEHSQGGSLEDIFLEITENE